MKVRNLLSLWVVVGVLLAVATGCGKQEDQSVPAQAKPLMGTWQSGIELKRDGSTEQLLVTFEPKRLTVKNTCAFPGGAVVSASAQAPVTYTDTKFNVTAAAEERKELNGKSCKADIKIAEVEYRVENRRLTLKEKDESITLTRVNEPGATPAAAQKHEGKWRVVQHTFKGMPKQEGIGAIATIQGAVLRIQEPNLQQVSEFALQNMQFKNEDGDVLKLELLNDNELRIYGDIDGGTNRIELRLVRVK